MPKIKSILIAFFLAGFIIIQPFSVVLASNDYGSEGGNDYDPVITGGNNYPDGGGNDYAPDGGNDYTPDGGNDYDPVVPDPVVPAPIVVPTPTPAPAPVVSNPTTVIYVSGGSSGGSSGYNYQFPSVDIKAGTSNGPVTVAYNASIYLNWSASNVNSCYAADGWTGYKADFGSERIENLTTSKKYTITCSGQLGSVSDSVIVNVADFLPKLSVEKLVRNVSSNTPWQEMVYAFPSEALTFQIKVKSNETFMINNVRLSDLLPSKIIYQGNLRINNSNISGDISDLSLYFFNPNDEKVITFDAKVAPKDEFSLGITALDNKATVTADSLPENSDAATVNVNNPSGLVTLNIVKVAKNLTKNDFDWSNEINAEPGDKLAFQISVTNNMTTKGSGFKLKDMLPDTIKYLGNLKVNGATLNKDLTFEISLDEFQPGETKVINFEAEVLSADKFKFGVTSHLNIAMVFGNDFSNFATTKVNVTRKGVAGATDIITGMNVVYFSLAIAFIFSVIFYLLTLYLENSQRPLVKKLMGAYYKIGSFISR